MRPIAMPLVCAALVAACGCVNHEQILRELADGPQRPDRYELGARDTVLFEYRMNPELNRQLTIGPHGKVHLPMVGEVLVAGKTPPELSKELTDLYAKYLTTPDVYVTLVGFGSKTVYVFGEVAGRLSILWRGKKREKCSGVSPPRLVLIHRQSCLICSGLSLSVGISRLVTSTRTLAAFAIIKALRTGLRVAEQTSL